MKTRFTSPLLEATSRTIVSCEANQTVHVDSIWITHHGTGNHHVTVWHVPAGQSEADNFAIIHERTIERYEVATFVAPIYLLPGDRILAAADTANKVSIVVYGDLFE